MPNIDYNYVVNRIFTKDFLFEFPFGLSEFFINEQTTDKFPGFIEFIPYIIDDKKTCAGFIANFQGLFYFIGLPCDESHFLVKNGVLLPYNGIVYKLRLLAPSSEETENPTLLWHSGGRATHQPNEKGEIIIRSKLIFKWKK